MSKTKILNYGDTRTIHYTQYLYVETYKGKVVSVWFRCLPLPFEQIEVEKDRADEMDAMTTRGAGMHHNCKIHAVKVEIPK